MARALAVECETVALMADPDEPAFEGLVSGRARRTLLHRQRAGGFIGRPQRVLCQQVQDVGKQQLLMLLLMMAARLEQFRHVRRRLSAKKFFDGRIDPLAISVDRCQRGTSEYAAPGPRLTSTDHLVIGVEQEIEILVEYPVARETV